MAELNEAVLAKIGVPNSLLKTDLEDIKPFLDKFKRFQESFNNYNVFVIAGNPTPYKDAFIILMLKWFLYNKPEMSATYGPPTSTASLLVIPSIESVFTKGFEDYLPHLAKAMYEKRIIICDTMSLEAFQLLVGKELFKYMSYSMGLIDLTLNNKTTIKEI